MDAHATAITRRNTGSVATPVAVFCAAFCMLLTTPGHANFDAGLTAFGDGRMQEARIEWQQCANDGHNISQFLLGQLYEEGHGIEANPVLARKWYCLASRNGYDEAISYCARLESQLDKAGTEPEPAKTPLQLMTMRKTDQSDVESKTRAEGPHANRQSAAQTEPVISINAISPPADITDTPVELSNASNDASVAIFKTATPPDAGVISNPPDAEISGDTAGNTGAKSDETAAVNQVALKAAVVGGESAPASGTETDEDLRIVQQLLAVLGYYRGASDGLMGRKTRLALVAFKKQAGLAVNDKIDDSTIRSIRQHVAVVDKRESAAAPVAVNSGSLNAKSNLAQTNQ